MTLEPLAGRALCHWSCLIRLPAVAAAVAGDNRRALSLRAHLQRTGVMRGDGAIDMHQAGAELERWQRIYIARWGTDQQQEKPRRRQQQQTRQRPGWQPSGGYSTGGEE